MAKEITLTANLAVNKNGASMSATDSQSTITMTGDTFIDNVQTIGNTSESLVFGDITSMGYIRLKNLDATNKVYISQTSPAASASALITLEPGDLAQFPSRQTSVYALSLPTASNIRVTATSK